MDTKIDVGVIGGSGLYEMDGLTQTKEVQVDTPFGDPSDAFIVGELEGKRVAFLARHHRKHRILPSEINFRANIYALKMLGARYVISASAVGSMKEHIRPGDFLFPDQFIDRTRHRPDTFFGKGVAAHVSFADPVCAYLKGLLHDAAQKHSIRCHLNGTYLCMEGPQFSTRAESHLYRSWNVDVIGMTNLQEAKLAREAEMAYATIAMATDFDCWHEEEESVTVDAVLKILKSNAERAALTIRTAIGALDLSRENPLHRSLDFAIITAMDAIPEERKRELAAILGRFFPEQEATS